METIKGIIKSLPVGVWVIVVVIMLILFWYFSDNISSLWEKRKETQFDQTQVQQQAQIDDLNKQRDDALLRATAAEAREQARTTELDTLKSDLIQHGVNIDNAQKKIDQAAVDYGTDNEIIKKVASGEISKAQFCKMQCDESASLGYPCRANYCQTFEGK